MSKKAKVNKADKIMFICRHTKKPVKQGECWDCGHHQGDPKDDPMDPRASSWAACKKMNTIPEKWLEEKKKEYKKSARKIALVGMMDVLMKQQDNSVEDLEEALLLVRLDYQK